MSFLQERGGGLQKLGPAVADHGAVTGVVDNPKARVGNGFSHFDRKFNGVERIAVALDDESTGGNRGETRRREVQATVTGGKGLCARDDGCDLRASARAAAPQDFPPLLRTTAGIRSQARTRR